MIFEPETGSKLTPIPTKKEIEQSLAFKLEPTFVEAINKQSANDKSDAKPLSSEN